MSENPKVRYTLKYQSRTMSGLCRGRMSEDQFHLVNILT